MKRVILSLWIMLYLTQALLLPVSAHCTVGEGTDAAFDGYLVGLADGAQAPPDGDWETVLPGVIRTDDPDLARALLARGEAEYVEENAEVRLFDTLSQRAQDGWVYEWTGAACAEELGLTGAGVRIAVIDSGVDRENGDLQDAAIEPGYDYIKGSGTSMCDDIGHGTQVVQMIAADRNDKSGTGLARRAVIVPLRCFSEKGDATLATLARAIRDAAEKYACDIINMSWGIAGESETLYDAVRYAYEKGCILTAAAGNVTDDDPQGTVFYPAAYDEVIGVGALTRTGGISAYSQQTSAVSVCAPGDEVPVWLDGHAYVNTGTSFSAPCAAAMLALAKERLPSLDGAGAQQLVRERAVDCGAPGYDTVFGCGALNVRALLGQSWVYCRQEGDASLLSGWMNCPKDCRSIAALYEDSGRMTACALLAVGEKGGFSHTFPGVTGEVACRLFHLGADFRPAEF